MSGAANGLCYYGRCHTCQASVISTGLFRCISVICAITPDNWLVSHNTRMVNGSSTPCLVTKYSLDLTNVYFTYLLFEGYFICWFKFPQLRNIDNESSVNLAEWLVFYRWNEYIDYREKNRDSPLTGLSGLLIHPLLY